MLADCAFVVGLWWAGLRSTTAKPELAACARSLSSVQVLHSRMSAATDCSWNERTMDLARERDKPYIPIRASEHTAASRDETAALVAESETEFYVSDDTFTKDRTIGREEWTKTAHYGAITQGLAPQDEEEDVNKRLLPTERKRSAAMAGKAYEKVASRNKRAEHATT